MTIGPAPMIRIEEMSVRLGMSLGDIWLHPGTKKGRASARPLPGRRGPGGATTRARALFRPESAGREGEWASASTGVPERPSERFALEIAAGYGHRARPGRRKR